MSLRVSKMILLAWKLAGKHEQNVSILAQVSWFCLIRQEWGAVMSFTSVGLFSWLADIVKSKSTMKTLVIWPQERLWFFKTSVTPYL